MDVALELLEEVRPLASRFREAGFPLYLVGGIVRDQLLGRPLDDGADIDLTTDARPHDIKRLVAPLAEADRTQGERFGTIGCHIGGRAYEITTHRGESYDPESRKPSVEFGDDIDDDLARRDFTVNAMAVAVPDGALIDPFGGADDLVNGRLRTPLAPEVSFSDDPLRMLRAARFVAGYELAPDGQLVDAVRALATRLSIVSIERRRDELDKLLAVADPRAGLRFFLDHGLAPFVVPDLAEAPGEQQAATIAAVAGLPREGRTRLAAVIMAGRSAVDPRALRHRLREMRHASRDVDLVVRLVSGAQLIGAHTGPWTPPDLRRLVALAGTDVDDAMLLASARVDVAPLARALAELRAEEDVLDLEPALDGDDVMRLLGLDQGAAVGAAVAILRELRIVEGPLDRAAAEQHLRAWWHHRRGADPLTGA
jgi:poly(A) polymerase